MPNFTCTLYLSLRLVKALRLSASPALLCSDRRCVDSQPLHDVTNFEFDLCNFFVGGGNGSTPRKPPWRDQKAAKTASVMIADLTHCHWDSNRRPQR